MDKVILTESTITLKDGTVLRFKNDRGYSGIMEVNGEGIDAEEIHYWLDTGDEIIYDGHDYKCESKKTGIVGRIIKSIARAMSY